MSCLLLRNGIRYCNIIHEKTGMKKTIVVKRVLSAVWWLLVVLLVLLLIEVLGAKLQGKVPSVFGYSVMRIVTGSMEDEIPTGTYILTKKIDPAEVEVGDIISFYSDEQEIRGMPNTHRVAEIVQGDAGIEFITRGDANPGDDTVTAKAEKLIGIYVGPLELLGDFSDFLSNGGLIGIMAVLWGASLIMIGFSIYQKLRSAGENPAKEPSAEGAFAETSGEEDPPKE